MAFAILTVIITSSIGFFCYYFTKNASVQSQGMQYMIWNMMGVTAIITILSLTIIYFIFNKRLRFLNEIISYTAEMAAGQVHEGISKRRKG